MFKYLIFIIAFTTVVNTSAQNDNTLLNEIQSIENGLLEAIQVKGQPVNTHNILDRMKHYNVPGVSIAIVQDGQIKWAKGYGLANTKTGTVVDENTLFQAGSISKPIAALAALHLHEKGKIDIDQNVNDYLVDWKIVDNEFTAVEEITTRRLLTHTAGTTVHGFPGYKQSDLFPSDIEVLNGQGNTASLTVDVVPGSIWRYSGGGYTVMEQIVENISGQSFESYLSEHILLPMGMTQSTYQQPLSDKWQSNISAAYDGDGNITKGLWHNYPEQAAAGLWTTPSDLALYCIEIQNIAKGKENGVLNKSTVDLMLTKHKNDWGLGPSLRSEGDSLMFSHGGKNQGFTNNLTAYAHLGQAAIIMTNADNGGSLIREIENAIAEQYNWPIGRRKTIEVIDLTDEQLNLYVGKYEMKGQGLIVSFRIEDGLLMANTPIGTLNLNPLTEKSFLDFNTNLAIEFQVSEGTVNGFRASNGMEFERIEE